LDYPYKLIVVDEISMLPKEIWDLLISHRIHVIALGDPGQLPPIGESNGVLDKPHIFLDEIMRQAQESEIIRLTMDIRAGKPL
jgi:exodeoxyribonuclease-5